MSAVVVACATKHWTVSSEVHEDVELRRLHILLLQLRVFKRCAAVCAALSNNTNISRANSSYIRV